MLGFTEIAPLLTYRNYYIAEVEGQELLLNSFEFGIAGVSGSSHRMGKTRLFGTGSFWWDYWAPFVSCELFYGLPDDEAITPIKELYQPFAINVGITGGIGDTDFFPVGITGSAAYHYDMLHSYLKIEAGIDIVQLSISMGSYVQLRPANNRQNYKNHGFLAIRYIVWHD